ncbi:MAG TPA: hypothetical protein VMB04_08520 [Mycobacterium sp.]|nr:hypothetical protein [Mycobacterium sp.]
MPELNASWGDTYSHVMEKQYDFPDGWVPNWPPRQSPELGDVGSVEYPGFNRSGVLKNYDVAATPTAADKEPAGPWNLSSRKSISVEFGTDASVPAWSWIGHAKAGVKVGFGEESGMIMGIGASHYEILEDLDKLRTELVKAGQEKKIPIGRSVIIERLVAEDGLVLVSDGGVGTVQATTTFDASVDTLTLASFAAGFDVKTQHAGFIHRDFPRGFCMAFRAITLVKKGWLPFRTVAIAGFGRLTTEQWIAGLESGTTRDDYFAPYPDADFTTRKGPRLDDDDSF